MVIDTNSRDIAWIYYVGKLFHVDIVRSVPRSTDKIHVYLMQPSLPSPLLPSRNRIIAKSDARRGSNLTREYIKITRMAGVETFKTDFSALRERERRNESLFERFVESYKRTRPLDFFVFLLLTHDTQKTIPITVRGGRGKKKREKIYGSSSKLDRRMLQRSRENKFQWKFQFRRVTHRFVISTSIAKKGIRGEWREKLRDSTDDKCLSTGKNGEFSNRGSNRRSLMIPPTLSLLSKAFELTVFEHPRRRPGYVHKHNYFLSILLFAELFPRPLPPFPFVLPSIISVSR